MTGFKDVSSQLKNFMIYIVPRMTPRSMSDEVVGYGILIQYRGALMFWTKRQYLLRNVQPPPVTLLFNRITEGMRYIAYKTNMRVKHNLKAKSYVGMPEVLELIEMDVRGTPNILFAEGHHFGWVIGRIYAVRPGALGAPQDYNQSDHEAENGGKGVPFLAFRDIHITRDQRSGEFMMELTIRNLNGMVKWQQAESSGHLKAQAKFYIKSPQKAANLAMSAPHRFLVLALRRGALKHYETIDELFNDDRRNIIIKDEFLDKPIIVRSSPRGLDVDLDQPATAHSLTTYIRLRGEKCGFAQPITFYSIRRRAGTDFARAFGTEAARELMCHHAETRTLERHYLNIRPVTDISAAGLGESTTARQQEMEADYRIAKLSQEEVMPIHGGALNALVRQKLANDEVWLTAKTHAERRNREKVLRRCALKALTQEGIREQTENETVKTVQMTKDVFVKRATEFNERLLATLQKEADDTTNQSAAEDPSYAQDFPEGDSYDDQDQPEADFEDRQTTSQFMPVPEEELAKESDYSLLLDDVSYKDAAKTAMELMYENSLNEYKLQQQIQCPLCLDDDTIPDADYRYKMWNHGHLKKHMKAQFHSPYDIFKRKAGVRQVEEETPGVICIFCETLVPDDYEINYFNSESLLGRHVDRSSSRNIAEVGGWSTPELARKHENAKKAYGWYDSQFKGDTELKLRMVASGEDLRRRKRGRKSAVHTFSDDKELTGPVAMPGFSGIVLGAFQVWAAVSTERFDDKVESVLIPQAGSDSSIRPPFKLPARFQGSMQLIDYQEGSWEGKPTADYMAGREDCVETVPIPGMDGNMPGDGKRVRDRMEKLASKRQKQI